MKFSLFISLLFIASAAQATSLFCADPAPEINAAGARLDASFSSDEEVAATVAKEIKSAKKSVKFAAHNFVSKTVAETLLQDLRDKKDVKILLDKSHNKTGYSSASFLVAMGYLPHLAKFNSLNSEYIIIDDNEVIIGNVATATDKDDERANPVHVLIVRNSPELAKQYIVNWDKLWAKSEEMSSNDKKKR